MEGICSIEGCNEVIIARGWCSIHYRRFMRHGDPLYIRELMPKICTIDGCNNPVESRGWCSKHYSKWKRYKNPIFISSKLHGMINKPVYKTWSGIKQRCLNSNDPAYKDYGGRGITVCKRWLDFKNFYEDMGDPPEGMEIDRKENDKGYYKDNCRWTTSTINNRNRRSMKLSIEKARKIRLLYPSFTQVQLAKRYNVKQSTIGNIVNHKIWKEIS